MLALVCAGAAPFCAGALLTLFQEGGTAESSVVVPCPFRTVTGLPCPLCGATRAFGFAAQGSADFLRFNAVSVAVAAACILLGALGLAVPRFAERISRPPRRVVIAVAVLAVASAWAWALAHRTAIVG